MSRSGPLFFFLRNSHPPKNMQTGNYCSCPFLTLFFAREQGLIELQMQLEDSFFKIAASTGRPSICFLDRGLLDIPAYLPPKQWQDVLDATGFKEADMAERYLRNFELCLRYYSNRGTWKLKSAVLLFFFSFEFWIRTYRIILFPTLPFCFVQPFHVVLVSFNSFLLSILSSRHTSFIDTT